MSSYTKSTDFASKDSLLTGNPQKVIKGTEIDDEFNAIQTAVNSKADTNSPDLSGTPTTPTAATATDTTQIASTAYVKANITSGGNVQTAGIADGAITNAKLGADAVNGAKIADNSINSEHYVDGSIDREHLAADVIDSTKLADNAVNSEHYVDGSIDRVHLAADVIDSTKLANDAVGSEHIQNNINLPGSPTTTTQTVSDRSTKIATTDFVRDAIETYVEPNTSAAAQASASSDSISVVYGPTGKALIMAAAGRKADFGNQGGVSYALARSGTNVRTESGQVIEYDNRDSDSTFVFFYTQTGKTPGSSETWTVSSSGAGSATYATIAYIGF